MDNVKAYSLELLGLISSGAIRTKQQLNGAKISLCKRHGISHMPSNPAILCFAEKKTKRMQLLLSVKPTRSLSGITVVAVMTKPHKCPGRCIYCPGSLLKGERTPKSYTGMEPATMRALQAGFSPEKQVCSRIRQLQESGHSTNKVELVVMGGTFLSQPGRFQRDFMLRCYNALNRKRSASLEGAMRAAETAETRVTGVTFETRPDFCGREEINSMLGFGGTRCELGVQTIYDRVYKRVNRGHTVADAVKATRLLRDSAFKVTYHYMPGLPGVSPGQDKKALLKLFSDQRFKPDALKIYPCLVIEGTRLFKQWKQGRYEPLSTEGAVEILAEVKPRLPPWVRVMRIQRDIPTQLISAGVKKSNLRQLVQERMREQGERCGCIRCREAGLRLFGQKAKPHIGGGNAFTESYKASGGREFFISFEDKERELLFGFLRLRQPFKPFRREIDSGTALVRELRVFGKPMPLHSRGEEAIQHRGLGRKLLAEAEETARCEFGAEKLLVITGAGVKEYYHSLGFSDDGAFVSKKL